MFWAVGTDVSHWSGVSFTSLLLLFDWDFAVMEFVGPLYTPRTAVCITRNGG